MAPLLPMGDATRRCSASASRYLRTASSRSPVRSLLGLVTEARVSTEALEAEARLVDTCDAAGDRGDTTGVRPDPEGASSSSEDSTSPSHCEIRRLEAAFGPPFSALAPRAMLPECRSSASANCRLDQLTKLSNYLSSPTRSEAFYGWGGVHRVTRLSPCVRAPARSVLCVPLEVPPPRSELHHANLSRRFARCQQPLPRWGTAHCVLSR